jgi:hypothetical protein
VITDGIIIEVLPQEGDILNILPPIQSAAADPELVVLKLTEGARYNFVEYRLDAG